MPRSKLTHASSGYTRATFTCPLCQNRSSNSKIERHLAKAHPGVTLEDFMQALEAALKKGSVRFELCGKAFSGPTGTGLLARERKTNKLGVRTLVYGGAPGLKK